MQNVFIFSLNILNHNGLGVCLQFCIKVNPPTRWGWGRFEKRKLFVSAIITEELNRTKPLKKELLRIKQKIAQALDTDKIMLQAI